MDELQRFVEDMENLGYSVNARNEFYAFIEVIDSNEKLIKECQKNYHLLDGIAYKSYLAPGDINYTIFNSHPSSVRFVCSRVLMHKQANYSFWDFNNKKAIYSNPEYSLMDYDLKIAEKHVKYLSQTFRRTDV